jgi:hypothetical protein
MKVFLNIKLFGDFILWLLCIMFHKYTANEVYNMGMMRGLDRMNPLYDIYQDSMPNLQSMRIVPEILHVIPIAILFSHIFYHQDERSVSALRTMLTRHGLLMALRALFFSSTLLPDSSQMCKESPLPGSCFDLIFSGHSTVILLTTYILRDYYNLSGVKFHLLQLVNLITCIMIVACRNHYTVDVLVSIIITDYVYKL